MPALSDKYFMHALPVLPLDEQSLEERPAHTGHYRSNVLSYLDISDPSNLTLTTLPRRPSMHPFTFLLVIAYFGLTALAASSSLQSSSSLPLSVSSHTLTGSASANSSATPTSSAAFPSLSGYSICVVNCLSLSSAAANCTSTVDVNCYCAQNGTKAFTEEMLACIQSGCSSDLSNAENLAEQFCALASTSTSISFPTSASTTPISVPSSTAPASTSIGTTISSSPASASPSVTNGSSGRYSVIMSPWTALSLLCAGFVSLLV